MGLRHPVSTSSSLCYLYINMKKRHNVIRNEGRECDIKSQVPVIDIKSMLFKYECDINSQRGSQ